LLVKPKNRVGPQTQVEVLKIQTQATFHSNRRIEKGFSFKKIKKIKEFWKSRNYAIIIIKEIQAQAVVLENRYQGF